MNIYWFNLINNLAGENFILDKIMIFLARYLIFIIPLCLLYLWFKKASRREDKQLVIVILFSLIISLILSWGISVFYFHPRPFAISLGKQIISYFPDSSFPSDHATAAFAVAFILFFLKKYKNSSFFFVIALLIGWARVFCGVHFPLDIIGGFFVAAIGAGITYRLKKLKDS